MARDIIARRWAKRNEAELILPERFGIRGELEDDDTGHDDTDGFLALSEYVNQFGGHVLLTERYRISEGFPILRGTWEFGDNALIRNTTQDNDGADYWRNTAVFIGTYFGYGALNNGINTETGYDINPVAAHATSFTFTTAAQAANVAVGSRVYFLDANNYSGSDFARASHMSIVKAVNVGTGVCTIRDPFPFAITANGGTKPTVRTDAGGVTHTLAGIPTTTAYLAEGVHIFNGAFESANETNSQTVHIACHDSVLDFRHVRGEACFGLNPCTDTTINVRSTEYTQIFMEIAYHHHRVNSDVLRARRVGSNPLNAVSSFVVSEYGNDTHLGLVDIGDFNIAGDAAQGQRATASIYTPRTEIETMIVRNASWSGFSVGAAGTRCEGSRIGNLAILGATSTGVNIDSDQVTINNIQCDGIASGQKAVNVTAACGDAVRIGSARLGAGPNAGTQYRVTDLRSASKRKFISNVRGHYTQERLNTVAPGAASSTSTGTDRTIHTYTVTAGTSGSRTGWKVRATGNIPASSNATARTVKIVTTISATNITLGTLTIGAGGGAAQFCIEGTVAKLGGNTATKVSGTTTDHTAGTVTSNGGLHTTTMASNDLTINLIINTHTGDTVVPYEFTVEPFGDEAETA